MALDVTLGQYYGTGSVIHRLDPRSKLLFVVLFIVSILWLRMFLPLSS